VDKRTAEEEMKDDILDLIEAWQGDRRQASAWYETQPIPSFGNRTAKDLVKSGMGEAVKAYIARLADGGYA
jgi:uncharacterized protein (DUF2384 family)